MVHVYRDGRDTAMSMSTHPAFRITVATLDRLQRLGVTAAQYGALASLGNSGETWSPRAAAS